MYLWLWRKLPGPTAVKAVVVIAVLAVVFVVLMEMVFPWVSAQMPYSDVSV